MVDRLQKRLMLLGLCGLVLGAACASRPAPFARDEKKPRSDRPAPFNPAKTYPEWAYDAPSYTKPVEEPQSESRRRAKDPAHFFTSKPVIMVHQPEGYVPEEIPRVAIWYTRDNGHHWERAGYFGRGETYYKLQVKKEGDYGIRFVGPGQEAAMEALPYPVCVHHVDMTPPKVTLSVDPEQAWYQLGQRVTLNWKAVDPHLEAMPTRVSVITDWASDTVRPIEVAREQADTGSIEYTIPGNLLGDGFRFRVDAIDRAGNIGLAYSHTLQIMTEPIGERERPPVQMSRYSGETDTEAPAPPMPPTPPASTGVTAPSSGGGMLPLEEIPVRGGSQEVDVHAPAERAMTPDTSRSPVTPVAPAAPQTSVPSSHDAASRSAVPSSLELLPLLPVESNTPGDNASNKRSPVPAPTPHRQVETHSQVNSTIIRDTPATDIEQSNIVSDSLAATEDDAPIRPVSVTKTAADNQPQGSQDHEVECVDEADEVSPAETESESSPAMDTETEDETEEVEAVDAETRASRFKGRLVNELRAAEAAVERLLAGVKSANGVSAAELVRGADLLVGGGLAAPMPATVISMSSARPAGPRHAWRTLMAKASRRGNDIWTLPRPVLNFELPRLFARESASTNGVSPLSRLKAQRHTPVQAVAVSSDVE